MKQRIWELDALRGICILIMAGVHFVFDLSEFVGFRQLLTSPVFSTLMNHGGILFVLLSGLCATLGSRVLKRGFAVFACGMLCTAVTWGMFRLDFLGSDLVVRFGILHCLGLCMLLWTLFRQLPPGFLAGIGAILVAAGIYATGIPVSVPYLFPLGLVTDNFTSGDYFPLLPYFGWFLIGGFLGKILYPAKRTLLPGVNPDQPVLKFLRFCGTHSLEIYLVHQPVIFLIISVLTLIWEV